MSARGDESGRTLIFDSVALLPAAWRAFADAGPVRAFNPGLLRDGDGWLFAYRVVGADGLRRIAICRLDVALRIIAGSAVAFTDHVQFRPGASYPDTARVWFADPRLYRMGGRIWIYWNSGWHEPHNCQFLQEVDPAGLRPLGHPRELRLRGERRKLEKNWTFFETERGRLHAIYSITPHRVLGFSLAGDADLYFDDAASTEWTAENYPASHGGLRGGAPPVFFCGEYWSFCHSVHDGPAGYRYVPAVYAFGGTAPFAPSERPRVPLDFAGATGCARLHAKLNPAVGEVIYPCGAAHDGARWLVSHGINDEACAISVISHAAVRASLDGPPQPKSREHFSPLKT